MKDILDHLDGWMQEGTRFALATLIAVERSAPRSPGATMAFSEDGRVAGSVTGGCVESALADEARTVLDTGSPKLVTYGIADEQGFAIGLSCGGTVHVFVDRAALPPTLIDSLRAGLPVALAVATTGQAAGRRLTFLPDGRIGSLGDGELDEAVARDAKEMLAARRTALRTYPQGNVFIQTFGPPPRMYIFGAVDFGASLARIGKFLGYQVTVCDPRAVFATRERFPDADNVVVSWPDALLERSPIDASTAVCVLSHDPKLDVPALKYALASDAGYIGAMGSKRTQAKRLERLREEGLSEAQLARIHSPIGLNILSQGPEETAVAIAAEIIALRNQATRPSPGAAPES